MGYQIVETLAAKYYVIGEHHLREPQIPTVSFDSIILEDVGVHSRFNDVPAKYAGYAIHGNEKTARRVDLGDVSQKSISINKVKLRLGLIGGTGAYLITGSHPLLGFAIVGAVLTSIIGAGIGAAGGELSSTRRKMRDMLSIFNRPIVGKKVADYRDAIIVEKAEKFIAPSLSKRNHRKPIICVVYGSGHQSDLVKMLRNPTHRRRTLANIPPSYREPGIKSLCTFEYQNGKWKVIHQKDAIRPPAHRTVRKRIRARTKLLVQKLKRWVRNR